MAAGDNVEAVTPANMAVDLFDVLEKNLIGSRIKRDLDFYVIYNDTG